MEGFSVVKFLFDKTSQITTFKTNTLENIFINTILKARTFICFQKQMNKKILFATALTLVSLGITHNIANADAQIIIDPVTKTITITGMALNTGTTTTGTIQTGATQT